MVFLRRAQGSARAKLIKVWSAASTLLSCQRVGGTRDREMVIKNNLDG
jgi:hypothetical protein